MTTQLLFGLFAGFACFGLHALVTGVIIVATRHTATRTDHLHLFGRVSALLLITVSALMCAPVAEIAVWAWLYRWREATPSGLAAFESRSRTTPRLATATRFQGKNGGCLVQSPP
jgi:hypothetical protein